MATVTINVVNGVNVRSGPGSNYDLRGQLRRGDQAEVRSFFDVAGTRWYLVVYGEGGRLGWIAGLPGVLFQGDLASLRRVIPPPSPTLPPTPAPIETLTPEQSEPPASGG